MADDVKMVGSTLDQQAMVNQGQTQPQPQVMQFYIDTIGANKVIITTPENGWCTEQLTGTDLQSLLVQIDRAMCELRESGGTNSGPALTTVPSLSAVLAAGGINAGNAAGYRIKNLPQPESAGEPVTLGYLNNLILDMGTHPTDTDNPHETTLAQVITQGNIFGPVGTAPVDANQNRLKNVTVSADTDATTRTDMINRSRISPARPLEIMINDANGLLVASGKTIADMSYAFAGVRNYWSDLTGLTASNGDYAQTLFDNLVSGDTYPAGSYRYNNTLDLWILENAYVSHEMLSGALEDLSGEVLARISGDTYLQEQIDNMNIDIFDLQVSGNVLAAQMEVADANLQSQIDDTNDALNDFITNLSGMDQLATFIGMMNSEVDARISGDLDLAALITAEEQARIDEDNDLYSAINDESLARIGNDNVLQLAINDEIAARISGDLAVAAEASGNLAAHISDMNALLSTYATTGMMVELVITEVSGRTEGMAEDVYSLAMQSISGDLATYNDLLNAEINNRISGDLDLSGRIDGLMPVPASALNGRIAIFNTSKHTVDSGSTIAALTASAVAAASANAYAADNVLSGNLQGQINILSQAIGLNTSGDLVTRADLSGAVTSLNDSIGIETASRISGDDYLLSLINTNISGDTDNFNSLSGMIEAEILARSESDTLLSGMIDSAIAAIPPGIWKDYTAQSGLVIPTVETNIPLANDYAIKRTYDYILFTTNITTDKLNIIYDNGTFVEEITSLSGPNYSKFVKLFNNNEILIVNTGTSILTYEDQGGGNWQLTYTFTPGYQAYGFYYDYENSGYLFVADLTNNLVHVYEDLEGNTEYGSFGGLGTGDGEFTGIRDISVDSNGDMYILDNPASSMRIQKMDYDGNFYTSTTTMSSGPGATGESIHIYDDVIYTRRYRNIDWYDTDLTFIDGYESSAGLAYAGQLHVHNDIIIVASGLTQTIKVLDRATGTEIRSIATTGFVYGLAVINVTDPQPLLSARLAEKADIVPDATEDNIVTFDANGNLKDSLIALSDLALAASVDSLSGELEALRTTPFTGADDYSIIVSLSEAPSYVGPGVSGDVLMSSGPAGQPYWGPAPSPGGSTPPYIAEYEAGVFKVPAVNGAPFEYDIGVSGDIGRHVYDSTTEEYIEQSLTVPANATGTVTFETTGYSVTAAASKNIAWKFYHYAFGNGESWDGPFSVVNSGDKALNSVQDTMDVLSFSASLASLGWVAGDRVTFRLARDVTATSNLSGDYGLTHFLVSIPRS